MIKKPTKKRPQSAAPREVQQYFAQIAKKQKQ